MGSSIIVPILILICFIIVEEVKQSNNDDLIKENCKNKEQYENIQNAKKVFRKIKISIILLIIAILTLILLLIIDFTDLEVGIMEFISSDFYTKQEVDRTLYFVPLYILIAREIIIQVKFGEFLLKFFNVKEPVLEESLLKTILYKKKGQPITKFLLKSNKNKKDSTK